jgi:ribonuclease-3
MEIMKNLKFQYSEIEQHLGYKFKDRELLFLAFIHRSFANEYKNEVFAHNERLEFLGDSVLGLIISDYLYKKLPDMPEGTLSSFRSSIVDEGSCSKYMQSLDCSSYILLGKGERANKGMQKDSILADVFEAIIAAIYLDGGYESAKKFIFNNFKKRIESLLKKPKRNFKAELQDYSQKKFQKPPEYKVLEESGPDHEKIFLVSVYLDDNKIAQGKGSSKKDAEQDAAKNALNKK